MEASGATSTVKPETGLELVTPCSQDRCRTSGVRPYKRLVET